MLKLSLQLLNRSLPAGGCFGLCRLCRRRTLCCGQFASQRIGCGLRLGCLGLSGSRRLSSLSQLLLGAHCCGLGSCQLLLQVLLLLLQLPKLLGAALHRAGGTTSSFGNCSCTSQQQRCSKKRSSGSSGRPDRAQAQQLLQSDACYRLMLKACLAGG